MDADAQPETTAQDEVDVGESETIAHIGNGNGNQDMAQESPVDQSKRVRHIKG